MPRASTHIFRVRLWPKVHRDIEIDSRKSLYDLAAAIVRAFGFDFDHAFGFFTRIHRMKWRPASSARQFRLLDQTLTLDQAAEF